jgi:cobalt-zinc-cadmium resistance protein CzcA
MRMVVHPADRDAGERDGRRRARRRRASSCSATTSTCCGQGREIERAEEIPGAADVVTEQLTGQPVLQIEVDRAAIARTASRRRRARGGRGAGHLEVGELQEGERRFPIAVRIDDRLPQSTRGDRADPGDAANGDAVPLARLARSRLTEGPSTSSASGASAASWCRPTCAAATSARSWPRPSAAIDARVELPAGLLRALRRAVRAPGARAGAAAVVVPMALALIFVLLYVTYGRVLDAARVFTGVPFAAIGGVVALWLRDIPFSVSAGSASSRSVGRRRARRHGAGVDHPRSSSTTGMLRARRCARRPSGACARC